MMRKAGLSGVARIAVLLACGWILVPALFAEEPDQVYGNHYQALQGSGLDLNSPVFLEPIAYENGVATYLFVEAYTGREAQAKVSVMRNPLVRAYPDGEDIPIRQLVPVIPSEDPGVEPPAITAKATYTGAAGRCNVYFYRDKDFVNNFLTVNLDFNDLGSIGSYYNDEATGVVTTCNPVTIWEHESWSGAGLFINSYVSISNLRDYGFNDKMSSHYIVCQ